MPLPSASPPQKEMWGAPCVSIKAICAWGGGQTPQATHLLGHQSSVSVRLSRGPLVTWWCSAWLALWGGALVTLQCAGLVGFVGAPL